MLVRTVHSRLAVSAVAFALACLVVVTVHELAHGVAGVLLGGTPTVYGFSVDQTPADASTRILTAMAGPTASLVTGLAVLAAPRGRTTTFWTLTWLWTGLLSVQEFAGYLVTGPFAGVGDVGSALAAGRAPAWLGWLGFAVGWGLSYLLGRTATRRLAAMTTPDGPSYASQLRQLGLLAWLAGSALAVVLSLGLLAAGGASGLVVLFEVFGVVSSGVFLVFVRLFMGQAAAVERTGRVPALPVAGVVVLVLVAVGRQVLLGPGLPL